MAHSQDVTAQLDALVASEPHVVGYSGDEVGESAGIRIYVDEEGSRVPDEIAGLTVEEVVAIGRPQLKSAGVDIGVNPKTKVRPLRGGLSISGSGSGTLGYFVKVDGKLALMSAAHVLKSSPKDVIQPSVNDGGKPTDLVAKVTLSIFEPGNGVDAASAKLEDGIGAELILNDIGKVTGTATPNKDDTVKKSGKNTGVTTGTVNELNGNIDIDGDMYRHMIGVKAGSSPFSVGGDSGSLVVKGSAAIGVLAGGTDTQDWVCYIGAVLTKLGATLAT